MGLEDVLKIAAIGIVLALLGSFFEVLGKKEYTFILFVIAYMYVAIVLLRFVQEFFLEITTFFQWMKNL